MIDFRISWVDRPTYGATIATWRNIDTNTAGEEIYNGTAFVSAGTGNIARVNQQSNSQLEAQKQAKTHWEKLHKMQLKASLNMIGNTQMVSKLGLKMQGFTPNTDGTILYITSVRHEIRSGYKTSVEATNQFTSSTT